jgi:hypothetical protein
VAVSGGNRRPAGVVTDLFGAEDLVLLNSTLAVADLAGVVVAPAPKGSVIADGAAVYRAGGDARPA